MIWTKEKFWNTLLLFPILSHANKKPTWWSRVWWLAIFAWYDVTWKPPGMQKALGWCNFNQGFSLPEYCHILTWTMSSVPGRGFLTLTWWVYVPAFWGAFCKFWFSNWGFSSHWKLLNLHKFGVFCASYGKKCSILAKLSVFVKKKKGLLKGGKWRQK